MGKDALPLIPTKMLPLALNTLVPLFVPLSEATLAGFFLQCLKKGLHCPGGLRVLKWLRTFTFHRCFDFRKVPGVSSARPIDNTGGQTVMILGVRVCVTWYSMAPPTAFSITPCKDMKEDLEKWCGKWREWWDECAQSRGRILRGIRGNVLHF